MNSLLYPLHLAPGEYDDNNLLEEDSFYCTACDQWLHESKKSEQEGVCESCLDQSHCQYCGWYFTEDKLIETNEGLMACEECLKYMED